MPANIGISISSGYRHRIQVIPNVDLASLTNAVYKLDIPYIYTITGVMQDFEDTFSMVIDLREKKEDRNFRK